MRVFVCVCLVFRSCLSHVSHCPRGLSPHTKRDNKDHDTRTEGQPQHTSVFVYEIDTNNPLTFSDKHSHTCKKQDSCDVPCVCIQKSTISKNNRSSQRPCQCRREAALLRFPCQRRGPCGQQRAMPHLHLFPRLPTSQTYKTYFLLHCKGNSHRASGFNLFSTASLILSLEQNCVTLIISS